MYLPMYTCVPSNNLSAPAVRRQTDTWDGQGLLVIRTPNEEGSMYGHGGGGRFASAVSANGRKLYVCRPRLAKKGAPGELLQCSAARPPEQVPAPRRTEVNSKRSNDDSSTSGLQIVPLMIFGMGVTVPCWFGGGGANETRP